MKQIKHEEHRAGRRRALVEEDACEVAERQRVARRAAQHRLERALRIIELPQRLVAEAQPRERLRVVRVVRERLRASASG